MSFIPFTEKNWNLLDFRSDPDTELYPDPDPRIPDPAPRIPDPH